MSLIFPQMRVNTAVYGGVGVYAINRLKNVTCLCQSGTMLVFLFACSLALAICTLLLNSHFRLQHS